MRIQMKVNEDGSRESTKYSLVNPVVDSDVLKDLEPPPALPPDMTPLYAMDEINNIPEDKIIGRFPAFLSSGGFTKKGELHLTLTVPFTEKYKAVQLTDYTGVMFDVIVIRRGRKRSPQGANELPDEPDMWYAGDDNA